MGGRMQGVVVVLPALQDQDYLQKVKPLITSLIHLVTYRLLLGPPPHFQFSWSEVRSQKLHL